LLPPEERATLFGRLQALANLGLMAGTGFGLVVGDMYIESLALPGWRAVYLAASAAAALLAFGALLQAQGLAGGGAAAATVCAESKRSAPGRVIGTVPLQEECSASFVERLRALRGRSVLIIFAQGAVSASASDALGFVPTWLRYQGLTSLQASGVWCCWYLASSLGALSAAALSDRSALWKGTQGRVLVGIYGASVILVVPWAIFLSTNLQGWQYVLLLFVGFHVDMAYVAAARPVLAEAVSHEATATAASVRMCVEGTFAAWIGNYLIVALAVQMGAGGLLRGGGGGSAEEAVYLGHAILYTSTALRFLEVLLLSWLFGSEGQDRLCQTPNALAAPRQVPAEIAQRAGP